MAVDPEALTQQVRERFAATPDRRTAQLVDALVRHLHAFASEVGLEEEEWWTAVDFLTRCGQISDGQRQELILLSDVLGVSSLVVALDDEGRDRRATRSTVLGPFFVEDAPVAEQDDDIGAGLPGTPLYVRLRLVDPGGAPIGRARVDVWHSDAEGLYDVQRDARSMSGRAQWCSSDDGEVRFWTVRPAPYPLPQDGPVGELLRVTRQEGMRPAHIHVMATADRYERLVTHLFFASDPWLDNDAVFSVDSRLVTVPIERPPGDAPGGRALAETWEELAVELILQPADRS